MPETPATQPAILTVTLNPALDLSADAPQVVPGPKLRLSAPVFEPGGGGINVARAIDILGGQARVLAALGGVTGARMAEMITGAGLDLLPFALPGETRQSLSVTDRRDGQQYRFILPGPQWAAALSDDLLARIAAAAAPGGWVVLSGSQPPGVADDFALQLAARLTDSGARLVVDTSGSALQHLVAGGHSPAPWCLRMDQAEAEEAAGRALPTPADSLDFAGELVARGVAQVVVLARGADGSVLAGARQRLHCRPPEVPVQSKTGAGDSFTGALVLALAQGDDIAGALRRATAAAAAAVMTGASALCRRDDAERLVQGCVITRP
ncbi:1-phosphofructokinase family hexose kinase [Pararhodobacter sp.]|uniref:1-phosphofructokinase family hexose kinase n=1 Tax=Pararhodobacter sp. TaxID=2127056 RepID=UPI002FDEE18D